MTVGPDAAGEYVLGYTILNGLSARQKQTAQSQFTLGKNADRSGPFGPVIVTSDEMGDVSDLHIADRDVVEVEVERIGTLRNQIVSRS